MLYEWTVRGTGDDTAYVSSMYRYNDRSDVGYGEEYDLDNSTVPIPENKQYLEVLKIRHCYKRSYLRVDSIDIKPMYNLRILKLYSCELYGPVADLFSSMTELKVLKISNCSVQYSGLFSAVSKLYSLNKLSLDYIRCQDKSTDVQDVLKIDKMLELESVFLDDINIVYLPIPPQNIVEYTLYQYSYNAPISADQITVDWTKYEKLRTLRISLKDCSIEMIR